MTTAQLRAALEHSHQERRKLSGIVTHWQRFAAQLGTLLKCGSIDADIVAAVKAIRKPKSSPKLIAEYDALLAELRAARLLLKNDERKAVVLSEIDKAIHRAGRIARTKI
jgi:hypothetical protein